MRLLDSMLEYNEYFVKFEEYQKYKTEDKYPAKRVVMFTCMDTRLVELATKSLNLSQKFLFKFVYNGIEKIWYSLGKIEFKYTWNWMSLLKKVSSFSCNVLKGVPNLFATTQYFFK